MTEQDELWKSDKRERWQDLSDRVLAFLNKLVRRTEENIVVVSHGVWIECCLRIGCPEALGHRRVFNCDTYACEAVSRRGEFLRFQRVRQIYGYSEGSSIVP
jgi:broad specificity phosphatase PhoE